jgi:hypothetical protein
LTPIEAAACRSVAEASNRSQLEGYEQRATQQQPSHEQFLKIFGPDNVAYDSVKYWHIDLDDNGIPDHFIISTQGTAHFTSAVGRLSHQGSTPTSLDDNGRIAADLSLLKIANRYYVLGSSDGPDKLWKWRNGGKLERLCIFPHREPIITLTADSVHAVCTAIPIGQTKPVEYPLKQSIEWLEDTRFFTGMRVLDGLALVDLNNDGYLDPVVRLEMSHAAGRGCDTEYLAITDATNTSVPDTPINRLLLSEIGGYSCGPKLSAFTFNSKTFLDARERNGDRVIYLISGTKASKVCTWKYQGIVEAVY